MDRCEPYCPVMDAPDDGSGYEFCPDCGTAWVLRAVTEVTPTGEPVRTQLGWVRL